ncbi:hypothetical protein INR49_016920 [Caranx melampygus]|nr:hypothetical protein INR49_016920 [Caranx melampygus]
MVHAAGPSVPPLKNTGIMDSHPLCTRLCPHSLDKEDGVERQGPVTFNHRHMRKAFRVMNELRSQNLLCDVTIVAEDVEIAAHRVVLAAGSPYFHAMFTGEMAESRAKRVRIKEMDGWTLGLLVDYIYTAEIQVTEDNVQALLPAAGLLQLNEVKKACCEFLSSQLHPSNCLGIRAFADLHACSQLLAQANSYAEQHFTEVMVVVGGQAPKAIRSVECYDFEEQRWYQVAELPTRRCRAGVVYVGGCVYAVGGFNGSLRVRTVDCYDPMMDRWTSVSSMQDRRSTLGAAVLSGLLYAVGGFDGSTGLSTVEVYNTKTDEWFHVLPMSTRRSSVGVGVVNGILYAVGGYDGATRQCLSTVEAYNPKSNSWSYIAEMGTRRSGAGVGVLKGLLYAVGGHDGPLVRKSCEVYDPASNTWRQVADMNMCRRNAGVTVIDKPL